MFTAMHAQLPQPEVVAILDPGGCARSPDCETGSVLRASASRGLLDRVAAGYASHYKHARGSRILWIDTSDLDFVGQPQALFLLKDAVLAPRKPGVHRFKVTAP